MSQLTKPSDRAGKVPDNLLLKGRGGGKGGKLAFT